MAQPTGVQAASEIQLHRWLYWQMLRRSPKYKRAIAALIESIRRQANMLRAEIDAACSRPPTLTASDESIVSGLEKRRQLDAITIVLSTYRLIETITAELSPTEIQKVDEEGGILNEWARSVFAQLVGTCRNKCTMVPDMDRFAEKWGLKFALPPSFPIALEQAFTSQAFRVHPVGMTSSQTRLTLKVRCGLPKKLLLAFIGGALHHFIPHTQDWKARSRKTEGSKGVRPKITCTRVECRISIPLLEGQIQADKEQLLEIISGGLLSPKPEIRLRRDELQQMFRIVDDRSESPAPSRRKLAEKYFHNSDAEYLVIEREKRYKRLQSAFGL